jgi:hypothetical protein
MDLLCCNYCHLASDFFIQISIIHENISSQVVDKRGYGFGHKINFTTIHGNICKLICRKSHLKSYHSDIKYHMTLNIIFSVALLSSVILVMPL